MSKAFNLIEECYDAGMTCDECVKVLHESGFEGYSWENVADEYEEIYCQQEGK